MRTYGLRCTGSPTPRSTRAVGEPGAAAARRPRRSGQRASAPAVPLYALASDAEAAARTAARSPGCSGRCGTERTPACPRAARAYASDGWRLATVTGHPDAHLVRWLTGEILDR